MNISHSPVPFTLEITAIVHDGRGLGFLPDDEPHKRGLAVFVPGALPGETILCQPEKMAANFMEARKLELLACSFDREPPICSNFKHCGGCPLQPLPYASQLRWKEKLLMEALIRIGKLSQAYLQKIWEGIRPSPQLRSFRNKITLAFGYDQNGVPELGFRQWNRHTIAPVTTCGLVQPDAMTIGLSCKELARESGLTNYCPPDGFLRFLTLRRAKILTANTSGWHAILLTSPGDTRACGIVRAIGQKLLERNPGLISFTHQERKKADWLGMGKRRIITIWRTGKASDLALDCGGKIFCLGLSSFFQVNSNAADLMAAKIVDMDKATRGPLLDLYCGVGAPGQLLDEQHESCFGIELNNEAIKHARRNALTHNLLDYRYQAGDVKKILSGWQRKKKAFVETVLVDPPRAGIPTAVLNSILALRAPHILYISCNPVTFSRDAQILSGNYRLARLAGVDFFPHTPHLECCSLWERRA